MFDCFSWNVIISCDNFLFDGVEFFSIFSVFKIESEKMLFASFFFSLSQNLVIFACLVVRLRKFILCIYFLFSIYCIILKYLLDVHFHHGSARKKYLVTGYLKVLKNLKIKG